MSARRKRDQRSGHGGGAPGQEEERAAGRHDAHGRGEGGARRAGREGRRGPEAGAGAAGFLASRADLAALLVIALLAIAVFAGSLHGEFVYDDTKQIVDNQLIQEGRYFGKALLSDVWAFKGEKGSAWSNYWRPVFVLWLILNYRLFGLGNTFGWHLANLLLHVGACFLAYLLLRRLRLGVPVALAIGMLFAVHPVHVESVAWISGSTDPLLALALLGSLFFLLPPRPRPVPSLVLFGAALLSKESAVLFPAIVFVLLFATAGDSLPAAQRARSALRGLWPFLVLTAVYVALHLIIIGRTQIAVPWQTGPLGLLFSAPPVLFFYLRQCLFPLWLGPSYPLRALGPATGGLANYWLPTLLTAAALVVLYRLARRSAAGMLGLALFLVPLLPALNLNAFVPEQIVHDRYLYIPLLGLLMLLVPAVEEGARRLLARGGGAGLAGGAGAAPKRGLEGAAGTGSSGGHGLPAGAPSQRPGSGAGHGSGAGAASAAAARFTLALAAACCVPLGIRTVAYNRAWMSERALWESAVQSDPGSASNLTEYARMLVLEKNYAGAKQALDRALTIYPLMLAYLQRAEIAMKEAGLAPDPAARGRLLAAAEADLRLVLSDQPDNRLAYERLAVVYQEQGRLDAAGELLRTAREKIPHMKAAFTDSLAVVLYQQGRKAEALAELEGARALAAREYGTGASSLLFHLGTLYAELGRGADARAALEEFLALSARDTGRETAAQRAQAQATLAKLPR